MSKMKLVAIYNVWNDWDLLQHSLKNINPLVDGVIMVISKNSNYGEVNSDNICLEWVDLLKCDTIDKGRFILEPDLTQQPSVNERAKRNYGLKKAKELGFTHFIMMDADEFYEPESFLKEKQRFIDTPDLAGLVCNLKCYFKSPTLSVSDKTLVPFIHKLTTNIRFEWNQNYPFAFEGVKRDIRIDPTRQLNINSGVKWSDIIMHHMSWVRSDIKKKIRNSTARQNIEKSTIIHDYVNAKPGYYCEFYGDTLQECENLFNLPEIIDHELIRSQIPQFNPPGSRTGSN